MRGCIQFAFIAGQTVENCHPKNTINNHASNGDPQETSNNLHDNEAARNPRDDAEYGPWMIAARRARRPLQKKTTGKKKPMST